MLSFIEIEDCFPDGAVCDDATGLTMVSAQWLHDFAHNVTMKEREACAKICEAHKHFDWRKNSDGEEISIPRQENPFLDKCAAIIRMRSNK